MFPGINPNLAAVSIRPGSPGIPAVGNITYTATQATIVFSPPDHNGGATIQSFIAVSTPGGLTGISTGSGGGSIVVNNLQPNTNYTFQVYAVNELATGTVASSITPIVTPKTFSYAPIVNSVVVNSSTQVTITYTAPTFTGGSTITSYTAVSSPGGITKSVATTASGTIVVTGLITATNYIFTVYATNSVGTGATTITNAVITFAIVPNPPDFGTLAAPSSTVINVPYTAPSYNGGSTITSYTAISTPGNIRLTTSTSASGTFIFTGLTTATSYSFKVYATNIIGNSSSSTSNSITTPSVVPFNPVLGTPVVTSATWITIPYTAPYAGGSAITSYTAISNPGGISATTATASSGVIVVKGLNPITAYTFNVYATNAIGNGSSSTSNSVTTRDVVPNAPTISSIVISPTTNAMNISYSVPISNGGSAITSYSAVTVPTASTSTAILNGSLQLYSLNPNTSYSVSVYATNSFGNGANSASITTTTNIILPSEPRSVSASASSSTWASISFAAPTSNGGSAITYYLATLQPGTVISTATSSPISFKGLTRATSYTATVVAYNVKGASPISNIASFSTPAELPTAATITSATTPVRGQIRVFYTAPADSGGAAITSYISSAGTPTIGSGYVDISGLSDNTTYNLTISAVNSRGQGPASNTIAQTTWGSQSYITEGAFNWVAPAGVKSVSVVAIGGGGGFRSTTPGINGGESFFISTSTVWGGGGKGRGEFCGVPVLGGETSGFISGSSPGGGYVGGRAGPSRYAGGGGGAGGYWGPGGDGGCYNPPTYIFAPTGVYGGQGGCGINCSPPFFHGQGGGGIGLYGAGSNTTNLIVSGGGGAGPGGTSGAAFTTNGGDYGGGAGGRWSSGVTRRQGGGGGLGYRNNISVTSGTTYLVQAGYARQSVDNMAGRGAVRIVWPGDIRLFPNTSVSGSLP